jgi:hypothetical protein
LTRRNRIGRSVIEIANHVTAAILCFVMILCTPSPGIEVRRIDHRGRGGRGVFATRPFHAGELIERVPVILVPRGQIFGSSPGTGCPRLTWYVFDWAGQTKRDYVGLALGYGSIYNHAPAANAVYQREPPDMLEFVAHRDIAAGEEITINYKGAPDADGDTGFEVLE